VAESRVTMRHSIIGQVVAVSLWVRQHCPEHGAPEGERSGGVAIYQALDHHCGHVLAGDTRMQANPCRSPHRTAARCTPREGVIVLGRLVPVIERFLFVQMLKAEGSPPVFVFAVQESLVSPTLSWRSPLRARPVLE
jgi:hypothetical protein